MKTTKNQRIQQNEIPPCDPFIVIRCIFVMVMDKYIYIYISNIKKFMLEQNLSMIVKIKLDFDREKDSRERNLS